MNSVAEGNISTIPTEMGGEGISVRRVYTCAERVHVAKQGNTSWTKNYRLGQTELMNTHNINIIVFNNYTY